MADQPIGTENDVPLYKWIQGIKTQIGSVDFVKFIAAASKLDYQEMCKTGINPALHSYSIVRAENGIHEIWVEDV